MGLKSFLKKIVSSKKEPENKPKVISEVKTNDDGSKDISYKVKGKEDVSFHISVSYGNRNEEEKNRIYTGKNEYGSYDYEYLDSEGNKRKASTSESESEYKKRKTLEKIEDEASKITLKFEGKEYNSKELTKIYGDLPGGIVSSQLQLEIDRIGDISNELEISDDEIEEIRNLKNRVDSGKWKSKMRSLRRKGKLEQHKIDALNKLGMIWQPLGASKSHDEWENNYISFKKHGLFYEIKNCVEVQRELLSNNKLSNENLYRLQAVNFPFTYSPNEKYNLTRKHCWELREKLDRKVNRYKLKRKKELSVYEKKKSFYGTKKQHEKFKESQKEVNSFYQRKFSFCGYHSLKKLSEKDALQKLSEIDNGVSYSNSRLKEFLDNECKNFKKNKKRTPPYVKRFYDDVDTSKLSHKEIYTELSQFNDSFFNGNIRKQACQYMLKYLPSMSLKSGKLFKEINYLISTYKKEKNKTELIYLKEFIEKYPILNELYGEKINTTIVKLKP